MDEQPALANDPWGMRRATWLRGNVRQYAREHLPSIMVPSRIVVVDDLPKLPNGKVNRAALRPPELLPGTPPESGAGAHPAEEAVRLLWADLLGREQIDPEADFFDLGGTSLTVLRMTAQWLADGGRPFDLGEFLAHPTARRLARLTGGTGLPEGMTHGAAGLSDPERLSAAATLPEDVRPAVSSRQAPLPYSNVLVTTCDSRIGPFLIRELLDHSRAMVHVLIRATDTNSAMTCISRIMGRFGLWRPDDERRVSPVLGELARPYLGITPAVYRSLSSTVGMIVHEGECFNYLASFDQLRPVNVLGTQEVLRLAATETVKPVHFLSLASVAGLTAASVAGALRQSKWVGEQYLRQAAERGIPAYPYRMGQVVVRLEETVGLGDEFLSALIDYCISSRTAPDLDLSFPVASAESLASAIAQAALSDAGPRADHAAIAGPPVHWRELVSGVRAAGRVLDIHPYDAWRQALLATVERGEVHALTSFIPLVRPEGISPALGYSPIAPSAPGHDREVGRKLLQAYPSRLDAVGPGHSGILSRDHVVTVPLDYANPSGPAIEVFAREVVSAERERDDLPWMLFLNGGPGAPSPSPASAGGWLSAALRQHRVLLLDQRGGGKSTPLTTRSMLGRTSLEMAAYLRHFRADNIVRDAEALRARVAGGQRWSLLGQSYGGFIALAYLSMAPGGLSHVLVSGGLPSLDATADEVYARNYAEIEKKNAAYYAEYPEDIRRIRELADHLDRHEVRLPDGDRLTSHRMRLLGRNFGMSDGLERAHRLFADAWDGTEISDGFRRAVAAQTCFAGMPLYTLQEFIYARNGYSTRWAAQRALEAFPAFAADSCPLLLFGEMMFPWMFREIAALKPFTEVAELLAADDSFPDLYNPAVLASNKVPLVALVYPGDPYTPEELQRRTSDATGCARLVVSPEFHHNGLMRNGKLLASLLEMVEDVEP